MRPEDEGKLRSIAALSLCGAKRAALLQNPSDVANYLLFAAISFNHASYQVGIDVVDSGIRRSPDAAKLYLARGVLQVQLSHYGRAVADFEKAHALDPKLSFVEDYKTEFSAAR